MACIHLSSATLGTRQEFKDTAPDPSQCVKANSGMCFGGEKGGKSGVPFSVGGSPIPAFSEFRENTK